MAIGTLRALGTLLGLGLLFCCNSTDGGHVEADRAHTELTGRGASESTHSASSQERAEVKSANAVPPSPPPMVKELPNTPQDVEVADPLTEPSLDAPTRPAVRVLGAAGVAISAGATHRVLYKSTSPQGPAKHYVVRNIKSPAEAHRALSESMHVPRTVAERWSTRLVRYAKRAAAPLIVAVTAAGIVTLVYYEANSPDSEEPCVGVSSRPKPGCEKALE
jgi:hypothetical protein